MGVPTAVAMTIAKIKGRMAQAREIAAPMCFLLAVTNMRLCMRKAESASMKRKKQAIIDWLLLAYATYLPTYSEYSSAYARLPDKVN